MKVKLIKRHSEEQNLTVGKIYEVYVEGFWGCTITNDIGKKVYIKEEYLEIVER